MNKVIRFHSVDVGLDILRPKPSTKEIPSWYRKMPGVSKDGIQTVKKCVPFLDSLSMGYQILLPADISWDQESKSFRQNAMLNLSTDHYKSQSKDVVIPPEFDPQPHKWSNYWHIKTPKGYSTLFIHPLNRMDLPFYSLSGVVDTDSHPLIINFPFFLRKDFSGVIEEGTPMIQAIPFKRDKWNMEILDEVESYTKSDKIGHEVNRPPFGWYKRKHWFKKEYR
jgi:hypothetical protein